VGYGVVEGGQRAGSVPHPLTHHPWPQASVVLPCGGVCEQRGMSVPPEVSREYPSTHRSAAVPWIDLVQPWEGRRVHVITSMGTCRSIARGVPSVYSGVQVNTAGEQRLTACRTLDTATARSSAAARVDVRQGVSRGGT